MFFFTIDRGRHPTAPRGTLERGQASTEPECRILMAEAMIRHGVDRQAAFLVANRTRLNSFTPYPQADMLVMHTTYPLT